jgi:hypothetical protein
MAVIAIYYTETKKTRSGRYDTLHPRTDRIIQRLQETLGRLIQKIYEIDPLLLLAQNVRAKSVFSPTCRPFN